MIPRPYTFAVATPAGEIVADGFIDDPENGVLLLHDFERCATPDDRSFLTRHFCREFPGLSDSNRWVGVLGTLEDSSGGRFIVAWSPELKRLFEDSRWERNHPGSDRQP